VLCRLSRIETLDREKAIADRALAQHAAMGRILFCMRNLQHPACFYAHANVKWEEQDEFNFKLCGPLVAVLDQRLLNTIIRDKSIEAIITRDEDLLALLESTFVPRGYARLLHLVTDACDGSCALGGRKSSFDLKRSFGRLFGR
jgi:hypothetical protein